MSQSFISSLARGAQPQTHNHSVRQTIKKSVQKSSRKLSTLFHRRLFFQPARITFAREMNKTVIEVQVRAVLPTSGGRAGVLWDKNKGFLIYVDQTPPSATAPSLAATATRHPPTP